MGKKGADTAVGLQRISVAHLSIRGGNPPRSSLLPRPGCDLWLSCAFDYDCSGAPDRLRGTHTANTTNVLSPSVNLLLITLFNKKHRQHQAAGLLLLAALQKAHCTQVTPHSNLQSRLPSCVCWPVKEAYSAGTEPSAQSSLPGKSKPNISVGPESHKRYWDLFKLFFFLKPSPFLL